NGAPRGEQPQPALAGGPRPGAGVAELLPARGGGLQAGGLRPGGEHDGDRRPAADEGGQPPVPGVGAEEVPVAGGPRGRQHDDEEPAREQPAAAERNPHGEARTFSSRWGDEARGSRPGPDGWGHVSVQVWPSLRIIMKNQFRLEML